MELQVQGCGVWKLRVPCRRGATSIVTELRTLTTDTCSAVYNLDYLTASYLTLALDPTYRPQQHSEA